MNNPVARIFLSMLFLVQFLTPQWIQTNGPDNGVVKEMYVHDSTIFAATADYVYSTSDRGTSWRQMKTGMEYNTIDCITGKDSYLFAGSNNGGLYRSNNLGESWSAVSGFGSPLNVFDLEWSNSALLVASAAGIYKTLDFGKTWIIVSPSAPGKFVQTLFAEDSMIVAGMNQSGSKWSLDHGATWSVNDEGIENRTIRMFFRSESLLYAGTDSGLFAMSVKTGKWKNVDSNLAEYSFNGMTAIGNSILAATNHGIIRTDDGWKTWNFQLYRKWLTSNLSIIGMGHDVFSGTASHGVYSSTDTGKTWIQTNAITRRVTVQSLIVRDSILLAGSEFGVYLSMNNGKRWLDISSDSVDYASSVAVRDSILYAANYWGLFSRKIADTEWKLIFDHQYVQIVKISGDSVYAGARDGLYFSPDGGTTFTLLDTLFRNRSIYTLGIFGKTIFVCADIGLYRTPDHGKTWFNVPPSVDNYWASDFAKNDSFYYAATGYGVFRMGLNETTWTASSSGLGNFRDVASLCIVRENIFLGMRGSGIAYSVDRGRTWRSGNSIQTKYYNVFGIGANTSTIFFGGWNSSVWWGPLSYFVTAVQRDDEPIPYGTEIEQNYPNPFNPSTTLHFRLQRTGRVTILIYDLLGREVAELVNEVKGPGRYSVVWDASRLTSGVYVARFQSGSHIRLMKMLFLK